MTVSVYPVLSRPLLLQLRSAVLRASGSGLGLPQPSPSLFEFVGWLLHALCRRERTVLVFGCAYWRNADESCSATTLRRRCDEWIEIGVMDNLEEMAREAYGRAVGLDLFDVAVDCCITKASCGGEKAGRKSGGQGQARPQTLDGGGRGGHPSWGGGRSGEPPRLAASDR